MKLKRHPLRPLSDALHALAMIPGMPLGIAKRIASLASRFYYSKA